MLGSLFTEEGDGFQDFWLKLRPLILPDPAEELVAIGRRVFTQFPGLAFKQIGHGKASAQLMGEDIGTLLRGNHDPKDIYAPSATTVFFIVLGILRRSSTVDTD
jgi:hypothetical protein